MLWALAAVPLMAALVCLLIPRRSAVFTWVILGSAAETALAAAAVSAVYRRGGLEACFGHLALDALSAFHLCLVTGIFLFSSIYARDYFDHEDSDRSLDDREARKFGALWFSFLGSMVGVLIFNNVGLMWVALESTTLASAFLICLHADRLSVEAAWKYLIICSAGIVLGLLGTVFIYGASVAAGASGEGALQWTSLVTHAGQMDPGLVKIGFVLIVVGYGTKVGLAPMHAWLPDAHSQAPTPVSAVFSGVLLNCAAYCICRFLPIVSAAAGGPEWGGRILTGFGLASMMVAAVFVLIQRDVKRLLAYSSVEHMGIITVGLGLGPAGCAAALYHTLNHSVSKTLAFFCAGRLVQRYGTRNMAGIVGSAAACPTWGTGLFTAILILIGCAPGAIFMSEFLIVRAGIAGGHMIVSAIFIASIAVVFCGALRPAIVMAAGDPPPRMEPPRPETVGARWLAAAMIAWLIFTGVWMPPWLSSAFDRAARLITDP
ncbi:hydrogenase 4 subunit F [bacterium]|nr:hydrogenase 4 subunit F [bacterium]